MAIIKDAVLIPLNRQLFLKKEGGLTKEDIIVETEGDYLLFEKDEYIIVKNNDCCRSIQVTIKSKD